jgi:hypothetical protein
MRGTTITSNDGNHVRNKISCVPFLAALALLVASAAWSTTTPHSHLSLSLSRTPSYGVAEIEYTADSLVPAARAAVLQVQSWTPDFVPMEAQVRDSVTEQPAAGILAVVASNDTIGAVTVNLTAGGGALASATIYLESENGFFKELGEEDYYALLEQGRSVQKAARADQFRKEIEERYPGRTVVGPNPVDETAPDPTADSPATSASEGSLAADLLSGEAPSSALSPAQFSAGLEPASGAIAPQLACGPLPNHIFTVSGNIFYGDNLGNYNHVNNVPMKVHTYSASFDDLCFIVLNERIYTVSTDSNGHFSQSVTSYYTQDENPVIQFDGVPQNAGHYKADTCNLIFTKFYESDAAQVLVPGQFTQANINGVVNVGATFASSNSQAWLFYWEARLATVRTAWQNAGFSTFFNAGYDSSFTSGAGAEFRSGNGLGCVSSVIRFGPSKQWDEWAAFHESGHYWQYQKQSKSLASGSSHSFCTTLNATTAFIEGFADWRANYFGTIADREANGFFLISGELSSNCSTSYHSENSVADFFADYFDNVNSSNKDGSQDTIYFGSGQSLSYLVTNWPGTESTYSGWYNDMLSQGKFGSQAGAVNTLATYFQLF